MTPIVAEVALAVGGSLPAAIITKATTTLAVALVVVRLARKNRAAVRHLLLAAAFAVLLVLPMASLVAPSVPLEVPRPMSAAAGTIAESPAAGAVEAPARAAEAVAAVVRDAGAQAVVRSSRLSASALLLTGWATGAVLCLLPMLVGLWQARTLHRSSRPWPDGQSMVEHLAANAGIHRRVDLLLHEEVPGPVSCGITRPVIVLPTDAQTWHADDLGRAMVHELEHVRRGDWASQCLARMICACYWFHPLVWIAWRQLVLEAERACDDAVLRDAEATAYADQLVLLAERLSITPTRHLLTMVSRTDLATRVVAVLDNRQRRGRAGARWVALSCAAAALLVMMVSPLRIVTAAQMQGVTQTFTGLLLDPLGRPLPDTRVTLWSVSTQLLVDTRSDQTGRFILRGMPAGGYLLRVGEFGLQGRITLAPGEQLNRDIALEVMGRDGYAVTVTVYSSEASVTLPPPPPPLPPASSQPFMGQAELDRCRQVSMFCRVTLPVQIARVQPVYPTKQRERGVSATVIVEGRVGTDGLLKDLRALVPVDPDFAGATVDALRRWQFRPIRFDDVPLEMKIRVTANFVVQ